MSSAQPPVVDLREQYVAAGRDRYADLRDDIERALDEANPEQTPPDALAATIASWLAARQLATGVRPRDLSRVDWIDETAEQAYRDGITHARETLREAGVALDRSTPSARLNQPAHRGALQSLRAEQRQHWRRLAADLEDEVREAVREAARAGGGRSAIADAIRDRVEAVGEHRAELIGETEPARAFHRATLEEYRLTGVTEVRVDWLTVGDHRVCTACRAGAAGSPYSIEEAMSLIPHHPRCRCYWEPNAESMEGPRR